MQWKAFSSDVGHCLPGATIVLDRFHISLYLNKAVDQVRRSEQKDLLKKGDKRLSRSKYFLLTSPE
ncbi:transposase [Microbulbifer epialgicus]|uniref:Transposase n=1 Tax=Microbulbifer epialgicus TaxID=393907 RepID=A0ABV4P744_9GAMM